MYLAPRRLLKAKLLQYYLYFDYFKIVLQRPSSTLFGSNTKTKNKLSGPHQLTESFGFAMFLVHVAGTGPLSYATCTCSWVYLCPDSSLSDTRLVST